MNREFTIAVTTAWQNVGALIRTDGDYPSGTGIFKPALLTNEGTGIVSVKGTGNPSAAPITDGGIKLSAATGATPTFEWSSFDIDGTWIKSTIAGNVSFSGVKSD